MNGVVKSGSLMTFQYHCRVKPCGGKTTNGVSENDSAIGNSSGTRSEEHTSELQSHRDLHSFPTRRSSDLLVDDLPVPLQGETLRRKDDERRVGERQRDREQQRHQQEQRDHRSQRVKQQ